MKDTKKLRLNVIKVKSFVTALEREQLYRIGAGAALEHSENPCGKSSDRVWACDLTDLDCDTYLTCPHDK